MVVSEGSDDGRGRSMSDTRDKIGRLLTEARLEGRCAYITDNAMCHTLRRRAEAGEIVEPKPHCFARASYWNLLEPTERHLLLMQTAQAVHRGCVFCRESAAVAYGMSVSYENLQQIHIVTSKKSHTKSSRVAMRHIVEDDRYRSIGNILVTSPERTVFDCTRAEEFPDALAVIDSALRGGLIERSAYQRYIDGHRNFPGASRAQRALDYADPRAENGGESVARAIMIELGFMIPELQVEWLDPMTGKKIRPDFLWTLDNGRKIAGELDGDQKYENPIYMGGRTAALVQADERQRESRMTLKAQGVCRFSLRDVYNRPYFAQLLDEFEVPRVVPAHGWRDEM